MQAPAIATSQPTHYDLLQLPATARADELRRAFRHLSKRYHPDTTTLPPAQAEEAFRQLRQAYAVLSDPVARRLYDAQLHQAVVEPAHRPAARTTTPRPAPASQPLPVRRALSGGEWFALLLLALALLLSLVLGIGVAWARGMELVQRPSWWGQLAAPPSVPALEPVRPFAAPSATELSPSVPPPQPDSPPPS